MTTLLPSWIKLLIDHRQKLEKGEIVLFDRKRASDQKSLSLVFPLSERAAKKVYDQVNKAVPRTLKNHILFQLWQGYHFTIQWAPEEEATELILVDLEEKLANFFGQIPTLTGKMVFPFAGVAGLLGLFKTDDGKEFKEIRKGVNEIWRISGLTEGAGKHLEAYPGIAYLSLSRYTQKFTPEEVETLFSLPTYSVKVALTEARLVANDKLMTPEKTEVLAVFPLKLLKRKIDSGL